MSSPLRPGDALSDTQRRFLVAVMQRIPRELVHEVYLFAPMKQGGVETGIAVVAIGEPSRPDGVAELPEGHGAGADEIVVAGPSPDDVPAAEAAGVMEVAGEVDGAAACDPTEAAAGELDDVDVEQFDAKDVDAENLDEEGVDAENLDEEQLDVPDAGTAAGPTPPRAARFTIHTARYRLQLKGPDRGKWDVDVVEEADAPLVTIDAVVRGVHRRSGEPSEVERLAPHDLARALGEIPWTSEN